MSGSKTRLLFIMILVIMTVSIYYGTFSAGFLIIDDSLYVTSNTNVLQGLSWENLRWAFTTFEAEFWHPLTWLSLMLDTTLFGPGPFGYHFTNLFLHVGASILVFLSFGEMTGRNFRSFILAALFAFHPLHVEVVAWVAERKEVLCGFFWTGAMYAYALYVRQPGPLRYGIVLTLFFFGLMSKSMIVTFPFVLLLLDVWPLQRWQTGGKTAGLLVIEKIPLFVIALIGIGLTVLAQKTGEGIVGLKVYSMTSRMTNAVISYKAYFYKTFLPLDLSVFYPFQFDISIGDLFSAFILLSSVTLLAICLFHEKPYLLIGWCWFLGTLVPVIGIVKIGDFAMADRYMYIPVLGLLFSTIWLWADILGRRQTGRFMLVGISISALFFSGMATRAYLEKWQDSEKLFLHAEKVTAPNYFAHYTLGHIYALKDNLSIAERHFHTAVYLRPDKQTLKIDLGRIIGAQGRYSEASIYFQAVIDINIGNQDAHYYMGLTLVGLNRKAHALQHFILALADALDLQVTIQGFQERGDWDQALALIGIADKATVLNTDFARGYKYWRDRIARKPEPVLHG